MAVSPPIMPKPAMKTRHTTRRVTLCLGADEYPDEATSVHASNPEPIASKVPAPNGSPPDAPSLTPLERLERLIATIDSVLHGYSSDPNHSLIHLKALKDFLFRATSMGPRQALQTVNRSPTQAFAGQGQVLGPREDEVDRLEREWWASEVVAAWYGPRPGTRVTGVPGLPARRRSRNRTGELKRDSSYVGLHDE